MFVPNPAPVVVDDAAIVPAAAAVMAVLARLERDERALLASDCRDAAYEEAAAPALAVFVKAEYSDEREACISEAWLARLETKVACAPVADVNAPFAADAQSDNISHYKPLVRIKQVCADGLTATQVASDMTTKFLSCIMGVSNKLNEVGMARKNDLEATIMTSREAGGLYIL